MVLFSLRKLKQCIHQESETCYPEVDTWHLKLVIVHLKHETGHLKLVIAHLINKTDIPVSHIWHLKDEIRHPVSYIYHLNSESHRLGNVTKRID